jgi:hypothetical protein
MGKKEDDLNLAFASKIKESPEFASWVLSHTKFCEHGSHVRLLDEEQASIRPRKFWWKHWWCNMPEVNKEEKQTFFIVFEITDNKQRFALHIENKKGNGKFAEGQAESYEVRARHMMNQTKYLNYTDFETILISPHGIPKQQ